MIAALHTRRDHRTRPTRDYFVLAGALAAGAILGTGITRPVEAQPPRPATPVDIVSPLPVPVNGTVGAVQSGAWSVGVSSLPAVQISGTPNVQVNTSAATPIYVRDSDHPARNSININICTDSSDCPTSYSVPSGKTLVIEYVSARVLTPGGQASAIGLFMTANGFGATFYIPTELGGGTERIVGRRVWLTADPSSSVVYQSAGAADGRITLSGYLIDAN